MSWSEAMKRAHEAHRKYGRRMCVYGKRFHDPAGLVPDAWIYCVGFAS